MEYILPVVGTYLFVRRARNSKAKAAQSNSSVTLRIINVTDVYMLDNFPSLKTLYEEQKISNKSGKTISILTGDFLAPYLLSSLDFGRGMIKTLNATPVDYLIWGNHEHDLPHRHVMERVKEYKGTWINTNMRNHDAMKWQVDQDIIEVRSADGSHKRKVGLISMLTNTPGLYRPNAFGGAKIDDPWVTAKIYCEKLKKEENVDVIVPLCHLYEPQDEKTCKEFDFPVVISGHDHHTVDRMISGSRLVKAGSDGHKCAIVDITWETIDQIKPTVSVNLVTVSDWKPNMTLQKEVNNCLSVLDDLKHTQLTTIPKKFVPLNSVGCRGNIVTAGTFLCTEYRKAFNSDVDTPTADCVLMPGGNVRGGRLYKEDDFFSLESLKSEIHPKMDICIVQMPGSILKEAIKDSHSRGHHPYFMQFCDAITFDTNTKEVTHINNKPLKNDQLYSVGYPTAELTAENGPACLTKYFLGPNKPNERHLQSTSRGGQEFLLQYWAQKIWSAVWNKLE